MKTCYKEISYPYLILEEGAINEDSKDYNEDLALEFNDFMVGNKFSVVGAKSIAVFPPSMKGASAQANVGDALVITENGLSVFTPSEFEELFFILDEEEDL